MDGAAMQEAVPGEADAGAGVAGVGDRDALAEPDGVCWRRWAEVAGTLRDCEGLTTFKGRTKAVCARASIPDRQGAVNAPMEPPAKIQSKQHASARLALRRIMTFLIGWLRPGLSVALAGTFYLACGCGGGSSSSTPPPTLSASLAGASVVVAQDGTAAKVAVAISGPAGVPTVKLSGLPPGITEQFAPVGGGQSGTLTFTGSTTAAAGS